MDLLNQFHFNHLNLQTKMHKSAKIFFLISGAYACLGCCIFDAVGECHHHLWTARFTWYVLQTVRFLGYFILNVCG